MEEEYHKAMEYALDRLNESRRGKGLPPLEYDPLLSEAAQKHAQEMAEGAYASHWDERGDRPHHRYFRLGIRDYVSENVWGQDVVEEGGGIPFNLDKAGAIKLLNDINNEFSTQDGPFDADRQNRESTAHTHIGFGLAVVNSSIRYVEVYADRFATLSEALPFQLLAAEVNREGSEGNAASFVLEGKILHPLDMGPFAVTVSQENHPGPLRLDDDLLLQTVQEAAEDEETQALCESTITAMAYPWDITYEKASGDFRAPLHLPSIQEAATYHVVLYVRADPSTIPYDNAEEGVEVPGDPSLIPAASWMLNLPQAYSYSEAEEEEVKNGGMVGGEGGADERGGLLEDYEGNRTTRRGSTSSSLAAGMEGEEEEEEEEGETRQSKGRRGSTSSTGEGKEDYDDRRRGSSSDEKGEGEEEKEGGISDDRRSSLMTDRNDVAEEKLTEGKEEGSGVISSGMMQTGSSFINNANENEEEGEEGEEEGECETEGAARRAEMMDHLRAALQEKEEQRNKLLREQVDVQRRLAALLAVLKAKDLATIATAVTQDQPSAKEDAAASAAEAEQPLYVFYIQDQASAKEDEAASAAEAERQYIDGLHAVLDLKMKIKREREEAETTAAELEYRLTDKQGKAEDIAVSFRKFKREIALMSEHSRTGKSIPVEVISNFETMETRKDEEMEGRSISVQVIDNIETMETRNDEEMEGVRLKNIMLRMQLKKLQKSLRAKEQLAEGLHMIDFEQLKIENQTLSEKIEERNEELQKLRKKNTITVQVLTHVKEKLQFIANENKDARENLGELDQDLVSEREKVRKAKKTRDNLRATNTALRQSQGLASSDLLVVDYEQRKQVIEAKKSELAELKEHHGLLVQQAHHHALVGNHVSVAESKE